jgi:hypothetical protein
MIDAETQLIIFLLIVGIAGAQIVAIVAGWIFDWREARRVRRIFNRTE